MSFNLTTVEIDACKSVFSAIDETESGTIDVSHLKDMIKELGYKDVNDDDIEELIDHNEELIEFKDFLQIVENFKLTKIHDENEDEIIDSFVSLGGNKDKTGEISIEKIKNIIKDFDIQLDLEEWIKSINPHITDSITYSTFRAIIK